MASKDLPNLNELEISLFGPGFGECVVVHLGAGKWMIVDSCNDPAAGQPVALRYLRGLGVDIAKQVVLVVVTHWHDDHIRGGASTLREAASASFACSAALRNKEFLTLLQAATREIKLVDHTSGTSEFSAILDILRSARQREGPHFWADEGKLLYVDSGLGVEVHALSPSADTITGAATAIRNLLPKTRQPIRRIPESSPNNLSVVLLVKSNAASVLLGGDLEVGKSATRGWHAVVASTVRPDVKSNGFKVSHHGSENGDLASIWTAMLHPSPFTLMTPYARGKRPLPSDRDVARLLSQTPELYCTAWPATISPKRRDKSVDRTMDEVAKNRRTVKATPGHIRLRVPLSSVAGTRVDLFDGATKLKRDNRS
jgi:Metallo-beta-lactamase superfamily